MEKVKRNIFFQGMALSLNPVRLTFYSLSKRFNDRIMTLNLNFENNSSSTFVSWYAAAVFATEKKIFTFMKSFVSSSPAIPFSGEHGEVLLVFMKLVLTSPMLCRSYNSAKSSVYIYNQHNFSTTHYQKTT